MNDDQYLTRQTLLMRVKTRTDQNAWEEFIQAYEAFIFHVIKRMNVNSADQEDLAQDVLIRLWEKLATYDPQKGRFRSWLSFVVRNIVLNHIKRNQSYQNKLEQYTADSKQECESNLDKIIEDEWKLHISNIALENIRKLFSGKAVEVFELSLQGLSLSEVSQKLDLNPNSAKVLKSRVKSRYMAEVKRLIHDFEDC